MLKKKVVIDSCCTWDGKPLPAYPQKAPQVTLLRITIPPHSKLDWHKHPIINVGYITKVSLTITSDDGSTKTINSGEGIVELVVQYHYGERATRGLRLLYFTFGLKKVSYRKVDQTEFYRQKISNNTTLFLQIGNY